MLLTPDYLILQEALLIALRLAKDVGTDADTAAIQKAIGYIEDQPLQQCQFDYLRRKDLDIAQNGMSNSFNSEMARWGCD